MPGRAQGSGTGPWTTLRDIDKGGPVEAEQPSGVTAPKRAVSAGTRPPPAWITTGIAGQLRLRWRLVDGATGYHVWITDKDPELHNAWTSRTFTVRGNAVIDGLESFKAYWFCISAIGAVGEGAQCDPALGRAA